MKKTCKLFGIIALVAIITIGFTACDNGTTNNGGGTNTYISYDEDGSRYKLEVKENTDISRAAFTPVDGDTYTLTVEGMGWGTSTGTVTGFTNDSYTLSNNGTALNLKTSNETISSIPEPIVYNEGEHSDFVPDGKKTPSGGMTTESIYFGTWTAESNPTLTITATGTWTFASSGGGINESGTYTIAEAMTGTAYLLNRNGELYRTAIVNYNDHDEISLAPYAEQPDYVLTRQ
jgi:hypothetical protein